MEHCRVYRHLAICTEGKARNIREALQSPMHPKKEVVTCTTLLINLISDF